MDNMKYGTREKRRNKTKLKNKKKKNIYITRT